MKTYKITNLLSGESTYIESDHKQRLIDTFIGIQHIEITEMEVEHYVDLVLTRSIYIDPSYMHSIEEAIERDLQYDGIDYEDLEIETDEVEIEYHINKRIHITKEQYEDEDFGLAELIEEYELPGEGEEANEEGDSNTGNKLKLVIPNVKETK